MIRNPVMVSGMNENSSQPVYYIRQDHLPNLQCTKTGPFFYLKENILFQRSFSPTSACRSSTSRQSRNRFTPISYFTVLDDVLQKLTRLFPKADRCSNVYLTTVSKCEAFDLLSYLSFKEFFPLIILLLVI